MHAHYAIQIAFGSEYGIRFRSSDSNEWTEYEGVIISSRQPHSMDSTHVAANAVLFVEPETREGRALSEHYVRGGITALPHEALATVAPALFAAWRDGKSSPAVADAARRVVLELTAGVVPSVVSDARILRAVSYINSHLDKALTLDEVAREAFLSPSRFRHLFVEETGLALRPYILWRRFLLVWQLLMEGESLSSAAHRAGFADAAHLTRTSRRMFGFPPSALLMADRPLAATSASEQPRTQPLRSSG
jgi:AraC family transcriptional regulator